MLQRYMGTHHGYAIHGDKRAGVLPRPPGCIILEPEIIRTVAGLGIFKHDPVAVVGLAADDCKAVVVSQLQIFLIDFRHLFHRHGPFAGDDGYMKHMFQIFINGILCNFLRKIGNYIFQKIVVIDDQRFFIQIVKALKVI